MKNIILNSPLNKLFLFFFVCSLFLTSCKDDDGEGMASKNIVQIAASDARFSTLTAALKKAGLDQALSAAGPFTVFAPTNDAFAAAGITDLNALTAEQLTPILLYHVVAGKNLSGSLKSGALETLQTGSSVNLSVNSQGVFINGSTKVIVPDIIASNGVIHAIDMVLMPPTQNIVQIAAGNANFSLLVKAVTRANLAGTLSGNSALTVFAPTNAAFEAAGFNAAAIESASVDVLTKILTYHVVQGRVFSSDLTNGDVTTVQGGKVTISTSPKVTVKGASNQTPSTVVTANLLATNGVIHVIDQVLLPN